MQGCLWLSLLLPSLILVFASNPPKPSAKPGDPPGFCGVTCRTWKGKKKCARGSFGGLSPSNTKKQKTRGKDQTQPSCEYHHHLFFFFGSEYSRRPLDGSDFVCVLWTQFQGRLGTVLTRQGNEQMLCDVEKYCSYPLPPISMLRKPVT